MMIRYNFITPVEASMTHMPGAIWRPVQNFHPNGVQEHRGLVLHVQEGDASPFGWFDDPSSQASSDFWVATDGTIEQYVNTGTDYAWCQAAGNPFYASVETEGHTTSALTAQQVESIAHIYAWGHQTFGWPLVVVDSTTEHGFTWHGVGGAAWGGHTGCPGDLRKAQRQQILDRAAAILGAGPGPRPTVVSLTDVRDAAVKDPPAAQGYASHRAEVLPVERALAAEGLLAQQWVDGSFGSMTVTAYAAWQRRCGFIGADADGIPGWTSLTRLGAAHGFSMTP